MSRRLVVGGIAAVTVLVLGAGIWAAAAERQRALDEDHGWEDCAAPRVAEVPDLVGLGDDDWPVAQLETELVADLDRGTGLTQAPDGSLLVATQDGLVHRVADGATSVVLDLSGQVSTGVEQGLLDIELDLRRGWAYLTLTNPGGDLELWSFDLSPAGIPTPGTGRVLMTIEEPHEWHNGGDVEIGPDGLLWLAVGDGGHRADPFRHGQDPGTPLGSILRVVPTNDGYEVPEDNPELGGDADPRVVAFGFRNPWRMDFAPDGRLWVTDVGQKCSEEISVVDPADLGGNYGWSNLEGSYRFIGPVPDDHVLPAFEYDQEANGCAITGGAVYRGDAIPELEGMYVWTDYCWSRLRALELDRTGAVVGSYRLGPNVSLVQAIEADADGELYLLTQDQGLLKLVP